MTRTHKRKLVTGLWITVSSLTLLVLSAYGVILAYNLLIALLPALIHILMLLMVVGLSIVLYTFVRLGIESYRHESRNINGED
jgi:hypothetical protein